MSNKKFHDYCKEIRKELGYSREKASFLMNDNPDPIRLEKIENNKVQIVLPAEVMHMAEAYKRPELCNYYCKNECAIGQKYIRDTEIKDLAHIAVDSLNALNKIESAKDRFLEIVGDEKVSADEYEDFMTIRNQLEKIAATADSLRVWMEKAESEGMISK